VKLIQALVGLSVSLTRASSTLVIGLGVARHSRCLAQDAASADEEPLAEKVTDPFADLIQMQLKNIYTPAQYRQFATQTEQFTLDFSLSLLLPSVDL
jgi:hypothetical protein